MTTPETRPSRPRTFERPGWIDDDVWPFPTAAIDVDGRQVVYTDTGGDGPVLLFCHVGSQRHRGPEVTTEPNPSPLNAAGDPRRS